MSKFIKVPRDKPLSKAYIMAELLGAAGVFAVPIIGLFIGYGFGIK